MKETIRELWNYRELFYFFIWRDIKIKYKQTILGVLWVIIQPLVTMVVFTVFFGKFAKMPSDGIPYPIFSYSALVPWAFFTSGVNGSGNSLVANSHLLTKIYFPRFTIPASSVLSGVLDFTIASTILLMLMTYYSIPLSFELLLWPFLVIPLIMLSLGIGMILSSLNVKYRDVRFTVPFLIQLLLFSSPIIYPISMLPEKFQKFALLNPLAGIIEAFRSSVLPEKNVNFKLLLFSMLISFFVFVFGWIYFKKTEHELADII